VDIISSRNKIFNLDCIYCQLGNNKKAKAARRVFVPSKDIVNEIKRLPVGLDFDCITFSGMGEPTLAKNLGDIIDKIRKIREEKIVVLTNAVLLRDKSVARDLARADFVSVKLDAINQKVFKDINRPRGNIKLAGILGGIKEFKKNYPDKLALQVMFVEDNIKDAALIAEFARDLRPFEVEINTPLRPSGVKALSEKELSKIKKYFIGLNCRYVYGTKKRRIISLNKKNAKKRHPEL
jgi:wyosine [tRNA(Phe)-imidazoG37] synthetase (radical SAM superfamily)